MFFRTKKNKNGSVLQLVESKRNKDGKVRQEIIASLGSMVIPEKLKNDIIIHLTHRMNGFVSLVPPRVEISMFVDDIMKKISDPNAKDLKTEVWPKEINNVLLDDIEHSNSRMLGPLLALEKAWQKLKFDKFLSDNNFSKRQINAAKVVIYNRLIDPQSENMLTNWMHTTCLSEIFNENEEDFNSDRFYRVGDKLLSVKEELEKHLSKIENTIFKLENKILLYDVTNSYFEGNCKANPKARRSQTSKENRTDCPLLALGLVIDGEGFSKKHEVFAGNLHDCKTLIDVIKGLGADPNSEDKNTIAFDGGIATEENLKYLKENGFHYIVNGKRTTRSTYENEFAEKELFHKVEGRDNKSPVYIRRIIKNDETIILCRSDARKSKEDAIVSSAESKFLTALDELKDRISKNSRTLTLDKGGSKVYQEIGKIKSKYTRASKFYHIDFNESTKALSWKRDDDKYADDNQLHGCYIIRTDRHDLPDDEIWKYYITLTRVESSFRTFKGNLGLRPFFHQKETRNDAHIFITILAYHLYCYVERVFRDATLCITWKTIKRVLSTHCYCTITVPTKLGITYEVRKPGKPDNIQASYYNALNIDLSKLPVYKRALSC